MWRNVGRFTSYLRSALIVVPIVGTVLVSGTTGALAQATGSGSATLAAQPAGNEAPAGEPTDYRLGSGDRVRITVLGQQDLTGVYLVDGTGMLAFPFVGQIHAGGLTASELEKELVSKLKPDYLTDPKVSAVVLTYRPFYIVGEVKAPGSYAYVAGMTVINAVALAGGFTHRAREASFYVDRTESNGKKTRFDAGPDTPVRPGDVITVPERYF